MASVLLITVLLTLAWTREGMTQSSGDPSVCDIPPGKYDGYIDLSYNPEPTSGSICMVNVSSPVQRIAYKCLSRWCCNDRCNCNSSDIHPTYQPPPCRKLMCYASQNIWTYYAYQCCPGYRLVNTSCISEDLCSNNYLRCQYNCSTFNGSSKCTCPVGFELNPADNRTCRDINECLLATTCDDICTNTNGSYQCSCSVGKQLAPDGHTCIGISTPVPSTVSTPKTESIFPLGPFPIFISTPAPVMAPTTRGPDAAFPFQYIIAIVIGSVILLVLLLLLILCVVCRRRPQKPVEVYYVGKEDEVKKKEDIDPYGYSVVSFDFDKKKDADYETIKSLRDGNLVVDRSGDSSAMSRGPRAQPNLYSSLSRAKPVARPAMAVVSDLNSDYAEILSPPAATSDI